MFTAAQWLKDVADNPTWREESKRKVYATLTTAPCTSKCWHAEEDVCRCSCGGRNHGIGHAPTE
jgi:hypothetical protein